MQELVVRLSYLYAKPISATLVSAITGCADLCDLRRSASGTLDFGRKSSLRALRSLPSTERLGLAGWRHPEPCRSAKALFRKAAGRVSIGSACRYGNASSSGAFDVRQP